MNEPTPDQKQQLAALESARGVNHDQDTLRRWLQEDFSQGSFPRSIHVAGTNGKGSVIVWLECLLGQQGFSSGSFISPHLCFHSERFRLDGQPMSQEVFYPLLAHWMPVFAGRDMTMFEMDLWMAIDFFRSRHPDWILMETGLGGDRDATTVLDYSFGILTEIGLDHMGLLGSTIEEIAQKKAGIIKAGMTVVSAPQTPEAAAVLKNRALQTGAALSFIDPKRPVPERLSRQPLYQKENFLCALTLLEQAGLTFTPVQLEQAIERFFWPARFEILRENPLLVLDGAHNVDGIRALCQSVKARSLSIARIFFSVLEDKQADEMIGLLQSLSPEILLVSFDSSRLADVCALSRRYSLPLLSLDEMMERLDEPISTLVCGSLYFCAEVLERRSGRP